jgi:fido (protein-threonine AMPylation protein)
MNRISSGNGTIINIFLSNLLLPLIPQIDWQSGRIQGNLQQSLDYL